MYYQCENELTLFIHAIVFQIRFKTFHDIICILEDYNNSRAERTIKLDLQKSIKPIVICIFLLFPN